MEAVVMRRKEVVQLLIEAGAEMDLCNAVMIINNFIIIVQEGKTASDLGSDEIRELIRDLAELRSSSVNNK